MVRKNSKTIFMGRLEGLLKNGTILLNEHRVTTIKVVATTITWIPAVLKLVW